MQVKTIRNVSDLRVVMHRNERPIYFISATNFNLLGIDQWARNWIRGIKKLYAAKPLVEAQRDEAPAAGSFKVL